MQQEERLSVCLSYNKNLKKEFFKGTLLALKNSKSVMLSFVTFF